MKRLFILPLAAGVLLCGCRCDATTAETAAATTTVEVSVCPQRMSVDMHAMDETALRDLNFWLCDRHGAVVQHGHTTVPTWRFRCIPGIYRLYVVANMGCDAGERFDPNTLRIGHADTYEALPMTYEGEVVVAGASGGVVLPPAELTRAVAKVSYAIRVETADIELQSVRLCSVPRLAFPFTAAAPSNAAADYTQGAPALHAGDEASGACYMLPNLQGTNMSITEQRQKNRYHAPRHASYLLIRALRGGKVLAYRVYLGENNTSDFNVRANHHYRLRISIRNDDEADARIDSYEVAVWDDFEEQSLEGLCYAAENGRLHVGIAFRGERPDLRAAIRVVEGDAASLHLEGAALTEPRSLALEDGSGSLAIEYTPACFDDTNRRLVYAVDVTDAHGIVRTFEIGHTFANSLEANVWSRTTTNGEGTIRIEGHAAECEVSPLTHNRLVLCREGCVLTAEPAAGCTFEGWYADDGFKERIAATPEYRYTAAARHGVLYARFKLIDGTPLDTRGTANCYLAPQLGTWYSFNASIPGNGREAPGLSQTSLKGSEARILWESGAAAGAVLQDVFFRRGRIYVRTGTARGNAVVGLFDAAGACIWSWHIWATDYDPEAKTQQVDGGAIFMDRNLGALGDHMIHVEGKGLYYQWGRKDPFPHPAAHGSGIPAPVSAFEGCGFGVHDTDGTHSPGDFSVAWSVAHPTTFLHHIGSGRWCYAAESALWHTPNVSGSGKTAYDPCPPGWRVPRSSAWAADKMYRVYTVSECGVGIRHKPDVAQTIYYPYTGTLRNSSQQLRFTRTDADAELWCADMKTAGAAKACRLSIIDGQASVSDTDAILANAHPVRCIKE